MSKVISVRDIQEMIRNGQGITIPDDALVTPSARDFLSELATSDSANGSAKPVVAKRDAAFVAGDKLSPPPKKLNSKSPKSELEAFFLSPYAQHLKEQICEMGHRLWKRAYVDGNGGNMAIRVGEDIAHVYAHACQQGFAQAGGHVPGGFRGQPASRRQETHQ